MTPASKRTPVAEGPAGAWSRAAPLQRARFDPEVFVLPDGAVLVRGGKKIDIDLARKIGGEEWMGRDVEESELWDPESGSWRIIPAPMAAELARGGVKTARATASPGFSPHLANLSQRDLLAVERQGDVRVALRDSSVLVAGGYLTYSAFHGEESESLVDGTALWHPSDGWTFAGDLSRTRSQATAALLPGGRVMLCGGKDVRMHDAFDAVEIWEPRGTSPNPL